MTGRLPQSLHQSPYFGGETVKVGISIGIAVCTENDNAVSLLARADAALYRAKSASGKKG